VSKKGHARAERPANGEGVTITETVATLVDPLAVALAEHGRASTIDGCTRFMSFDSIRWRCACGASGPVGRTNDGIPDTSGDILRHQPGVSKE